MSEKWNVEKPGEYGKTKKGGTRKIADAPIPCPHPGHEPPSHMVFPPGTYEHVCPACGHKTIFTVPFISC
jgi:hypothetical protein